MIALGEVAQKKVKELLTREATPEHALRVAVQPGGCSGLRYALYFDDRKLDGDEEQQFDGVTVRVDKMSATYLNGAEVDWIEGLQESGFTVKNPNAGGSCACGDSFH